MDRKKLDPNFNIFDIWKEKLCKACLSPDTYIEEKEKIIDVVVYNGNHSIDIVIQWTEAKTCNTCGFVSTDELEALWE